MELREFLIKAKKVTYANEKAKEVKIKGGGKLLLFSNKNFHYQDKYFGANPFSGEEIVLDKDKVIWIMNYYGKAKNEKIYAFLKRALMKVDKNKPFRGSAKFKEGKFEYRTNLVGNWDMFSGTEEIYLNKKKVYQGHYHGGFVK